MPTSFENFVNTELPKRIGTNEHPATVVAGRVPVYTGVGLLTEAQAVEDIVPSEVLWYPDLASFPVEGELEKLYVAEDTDTVYRWKGLAYAIVGSPLLNADAVAETEGRVFLSPEQKTVATQAASSSQSGYLTSADWSTFNGKQNALADVITSGTYGSSTQYPVITFNAKGIATAVTLQTVSVAEVSDNVFRIKDNDDATKKIAFEASPVGTGQVCTITMPNADVNLTSVAGMHKSAGLKTVTKQFYTTFPNGVTTPKYLTTDGSTPSFVPPEDPFLFIPLPDDDNSARPVLVNIKGIGYTTDFPAVGTWVFQRRIIVGRGTEGGVDVYGGIPLLETVSNFAYGPFNGAVFNAYQRNNADIVGSQRVLTLTAQLPNNTGFNCVVRVIAEIIYSEDTILDSWLQ